MKDNHYYTKIPLIAYDLQNRYAGSFLAFQMDEFLSYPLAPLAWGVGVWGIIADTDPAVAPLANSGSVEVSPKSCKVILQY